MRIYIGNQTAFSAGTVMEPFEYALENGFDAFEWFPDRKPWGAGWDENNLDAGLCADIREAAVRHGMRMSVHARWQANPLRSEAWLLFLRDVQLACDLGASLINIHFYGEQGVEAYVRAIGRYIKRSAEANLQLSIENTVESCPEEFNELFTRMNQEHPSAARHVGMCLDIGHANLCATTRNDYLAFVDRLSPDVRINHLHAHENWGDCDSHLPLFTGPAGRDSGALLELFGRLKQRNYSGSIILEQWPWPPSLLNQARDGLRQLLSLASDSTNTPKGIAT